MNKVKLTANILFSGIGCQERGIKKLNSMEKRENKYGFFGVNRIDG